jgi:hypothetical protein
VGGSRPKYKNIVLLIAGQNSIFSIFGPSNHVNVWMFITLGWSENNWLRTIDSRNHAQNQLKTDNTLTLGSEARVVTA